MFSVEELKNRKLVQWALAYLAGAWMVLQLLDVVAESWGIGPGFLLGVQILLAFGFFATLVLAWYHGEQGRQRVSGPELLMLTALLIVAGAAVTFVRAGDDAPAEVTDAASMAAAADSIPERSLAVLPLDNLSPAQEHAYFAGAMTEAITNALEEVPTFRVISRNSAARFAESDKTVGDFAREELGVAHVIEGSVQREGDRALITVQLIDTATEEHVWSEAYDVELIDVIDVQADIAQQVADQLAATFTERDRRRILAGATDDPVAYDLYLRAIDLEQGNLSPERTQRRLDLLREARQRDPRFGLALGELARAYFFQRIHTGDEHWTDSIRFALDQAIGFVEEPALEAVFEAMRRLFTSREGPREAISLLREAVEENPTNVELLAHLASAYWWTGDLGAAVHWLRRVSELDPLDPEPLVSLGSHFKNLGLYAEARRVLERAIALDPELQGAWSHLVEIHLLRGEYEAALAVTDSAAVSNPGDFARLAGVVLLWAGDVNAAHETFERFPDHVDETFGLMPDIVHAYLRAGDSARANQLLTRIDNRVRRVPPDPIRNFVALGIPVVRADTAEAVQALRFYREHGGREVRWIEQSPAFARVAADPAFRAELEALKRTVERQRRQVERELAEGDG